MLWCCGLQQMLQRMLWCCGPQKMLQQMLWPYLPGIGGIHPQTVVEADAQVGCDGPDDCRDAQQLSELLGEALDQAAHVCHRIDPRAPSECLPLLLALQIAWSQQRWQQLPTLLA